MRGARLTESQISQFVRREMRTNDPKACGDERHERVSLRRVQAFIRFHDIQQICMTKLREIERELRSRAFTCLLFSTSLIIYFKSRLYSSFHPKDYNEGKGGIYRTSTSRRSNKITTQLGAKPSITRSGESETKQPENEVEYGTEESHGR